jgi:hypothetical protein
MFRIYNYLLPVQGYYKRVGVLCKTKDRHEFHEFPRAKDAEDKALKEKNKK